MTAVSATTSPALANRGTVAAADACCLRPDDLWERLFVAGMCLAMTLAATGYIWFYAVSIPFVDDWTHFAQMAKPEGMTASWLWSQHNEHRYPLSSIMMWYAWSWTGGDLRLGMLCGMLPLAATTWYLCWIARRRRGRAEFADAFFPLTLLHLGHAENFLWFVQSFFIWASVFALLVMGAFLDLRWTRRVVGVIAVGLCLLLLPLQGAMGVAYVPAFAFAFALLAWRERQADDPGAGRRSLLIAAFATLGLVLVAAYFWDFQNIAHHKPASRALSRVVGSTFQFLAMGMGPTAERLWPASGALTAVALLASVAALAVAFMRSCGDERLRNFLLLVAGGAVCSLALGVAWGRQNALAGRYVVLAAPLWCWFYLAWIAPPWPALGRFVRMSLFTLMCALVMYHVSMGLELAKTRQAMAAEFYREIDAGVPISGLVQWANFWCWDEAPFRSGLEFMRKGRVGRFADIADEPETRTITLDAEATEATAAEQNADGWLQFTDESQLRYELPDPGFVYAIRLRYNLAAAVDPIDLRVSWTRADEDDPRSAVDHREFVIKVNTGPQPKAQTIWIGEPIGDFAISFGPDLTRVQIVEATVSTRP
jgi:hypothetical protein